MLKKSPLENARGAKLRSSQVLRTRQLNLITDKEGNMAQKKKKPVAQRSRRSGVKKAELVKSNQEVIGNVWTYLNQNQLRSK